MLRRFFSSDPDRHAELVTLAYRTVLHRAPDAEGLQGYCRQLASGELDAAGLLRVLSESAEFAALGKRLTGDALFTGSAPPLGLDAEQRELSAALAASAVIAWDAYLAQWRQVFENPDYPLVIGQREYGVTHQRRFFEMINALAILGAGQPGARILEFGASDFSVLYRRFFPEASLAIADRPVPPDYIGFTVEVALGKLGASAWHTIDLQAPQTFAALSATLPRYTHLLFCEVLEHLVVHPVEVLRLLLSLLTDDGLLYLTTPNFFRRENLQKMQRRENPQAIYPLSGGNWDAHFHHREFDVRELLALAQEAGASVRACCFSGCWDAPDALSGETVAGDAVAYQDETLGNLVLVLARAPEADAR